MMTLVTAEEMRALDRHTIEELGVPGVVLMESAGRAVVDLIASLGAVAGRRVVVMAGGGNNGGDGFVIARHLHNRGARVKLVLVADPDRIVGDAKVHFEAMRLSGVPILPGDAAHFQNAEPAVDDAEILVDALLGTGASRPVQAHLARVIARMNAAPGLRIAVDVPSGLDVDTGHPLGMCVSAHHTVTFAFAKVGLVTAPGFVYAGELHVADIGIPMRPAASIRRVLLDDSCLAPLAAPRPPLSHKGTFGHLLIVAGSLHHPGAALLAAEAAARAGAGLVTLASPDETERTLAGRVREVSTASLGPESAGSSESFDPNLAWHKLEALLVGKRAVALGPGVPRTPGMREVLEKLLASYAGPLVLDADGLNLLAAAPAKAASPTPAGSGPSPTPAGSVRSAAVVRLAPLVATKAQVVVTPHPAEMARLAGLTTDAVQADRVKVARDFAADIGVVVVLKGARTVIASPDGRVAINPTGNPGLAAGGTGDVLTGVIGALLASGMAPWEAATAGVYLHGRAADLARMDRGEAGLLASDVIDRLPAARRSRAGDLR